jgi:hypothetical protein
MFCNSAEGQSRNQVSRDLSSGVALEAISVRVYGFLIALEKEGEAMGQHLNVEVEAKANNTTVDPEKANELIGLTEELLRRYGRNIDADNLIVRCLAMSEFLITACSVQPDLTVFRISHLDNEQNISQLFAATQHCGSGITDLQLYRDGPWEETFRKIGTEMVDLDPSQH